MAEVGSADKGRGQAAAAGRGQGRAIAAEADPETGSWAAVGQAALVEGGEVGPETGEAATNLAAAATEVIEVTSSGGGGGG